MSITPSPALREMAEHIAGTISVEVFYSEDGSQALVHYADDEINYFISLLEDENGQVHTSSLTTDTSEDEAGWQTGWEA